MFCRSQHKPSQTNNGESWGATTGRAAYRKGKHPSLCFKSPGHSNFHLEGFECHRASVDLFTMLI
eukprot:1148469-Pelagomonas_calceolata.AAC.2